MISGGQTGKNSYLHRYQTHSFDQMYPSLEFHDDILYSSRYMIKMGGVPIFIVLPRLSLTQRKSFWFQTECIDIITADLYGKISNFPSSFLVIEFLFTANRQRDDRIYELNIILIQITFWSCNTVSAIQNV